MDVVAAGSSVNVETLEDHHHHVKVVIINTEYVETDAVNFKSVVQKLTGKDSPDTASFKQPKRRRRRNIPRHVTPSSGTGGTGGCGGGGGGRPVLMSDLSFKEFERLLQEIPFQTMDELLLFSTTDH